MTQPNADLIALLKRIFPIEAGDVCVDLIFTEGSPAIVEDHMLHATLRLIVWDTHNGARSIRDIKEQTVMLADHQTYENLERFEAGMLAHVQVLAHLFSDTARDVEEYLPTDLFHSGIFRLRRAQTTQDFLQALARSSRHDVPELL